MYNCGTTKLDLDIIGLHEGAPKLFSGLNFDFDSQTMKYMINMPLRLMTYLLIT